MLCKSELSRRDVAKALEVIASWCYYNLCITCPLLSEDDRCKLLMNIPSEYSPDWMHEVTKEGR